MPWAHQSALAGRARSFVHLSHSRLRVVARLTDSSVTTFRDQAFKPELPHLLLQSQFSDLPALTKWFIHPSANHDAGSSTLDRAYLEQYATTSIPIEVSTPTAFQRLSLPLSTFLAHTTSSTSSGAARVYIAQAPLSDLPAALRADLPTPAAVLEAGRGDVYETSIWLGLAPTYTPLHRDPNPNLFVQLAGRKRVRLFAPHVGRDVFALVQRQIGGKGDAVFRGEEMMHGPEREVLEQAVWGAQGEERPWLDLGWEAEVHAGDGLFIPKGWWHSVKGLGTGMTGSVNWWFR